MFMLPTRHELVKFGWIDRFGCLTHPDSPITIVSNMFSILGTEITIKSKDKDFDGCYGVEEDPWNFTWCIDLLDKQMNEYLYGTMKSATYCNNVCEEGMTPIFGYFICKYCGKNMRKI